MCGSLDRNGLERKAIAAHSLYIAALARAERVQFDLQYAVSGATNEDLWLAERELDQQFFTLRDLLNALGYVPPGFTARLPPELAPPRSTDNG